MNALRVNFPSVDYRSLHVDLSSQTSARKAKEEALAWPDISTDEIVIKSAVIMGISERILNKDVIQRHVLSRAEPSNNRC